MQGGERRIVRKKDRDRERDIDRDEIATRMTKFEVFGEEMIAKEVKPSGNSGRVYLPPDWVGKHVKIIRVD